MFARPPAAMPAAGRFCGICHQVGFAMDIGGGDQLATAIDGCYMTGSGDETRNYVAIDYDAIVTPLSSAVTNTAVASVVFVIKWDT